MNAFRGRGIRLAPDFANAAEGLDDLFLLVDEDCGSSGSALRRGFCGEVVGDFVGVVSTGGVRSFVTILGVRYGSFS